MSPAKIAIIIVCTIVGVVALLIIVMRIFSNKIFAHRVEGDIRFGFKSPRDYPGLKHDNVSITNKHKVALNGGLYYYPDRKYKALIIFYHGFLSGRLNYINVIEYLARHDYKVLAFDFMGTMSSEGKKIRGMVNVTSDVRDIIRYAIKNPDFSKLPIYTMGHSMGGYSAMISLLYNDTRISKGVAICPYNSNVSCTYSFNPVLKIFGPVVFLYNLIFYGYTSIYKVTDVLKFSNAKKMIICGGRDEIVREEYAYEKFKKLAYDKDAPKKKFSKKVTDKNLSLVYLKDADHFAYMDKKGANNFTENVAFPRKEPVVFEKIKYDDINSLNKDLFDKIFAFLDN